ncbi:RagB/SusD family nutrient uptake outer membrane protein [Hymenobacter terricola]|uniref:RagB/SusD family nutrient uptake outer membrane protein n=1 Tax=Hymenobacter terricola TaxID=2819236 RepID=UPI001B305BBF|nr:RagB/SusD family nutrient uptake outer membrane protein [Hymenobacter terricola]
MKNIFNIIAGSRQRVLAVAFTATLGLGACQVTDLQPKDVLSETAVYNDPARIALAVAGVYNSAQSGFYDPLNGTALGVRGYPFGAASIDLGDARGEDVTDMLGFFGIVFSNTVTTASPNIVNMWSNCYAVANQANVTIEGVRKAAAAGVITAADAAAYEGELRFLRALAHHELVLNYSRPFAENNGSSPGVPYRDVPVNTIAGLELAKSQGRGTVADDYAKILADLDFAEANLPVTRTLAITPAPPAPSVTRATKGAAIALKQRIRLHQANWAELVREGSKLITGTTTFTSPAPFGGATAQYQLMPTQRAAFPGGPVATAESIFSIENSTADNTGVNGGLSSVFATTTINGRSLLGVSPILYNAPFFTCADLRRTAMMVANPAAPACYVIRKYTDPANNSDFAPIIRYAEVLLNQAEALARTGNSPLALSLLNAVRNRSVTTAADQFAAGSLTGNALVQAILNERRIEFVGEGKRWGDISRLSSEAAFAPIPGGGIPAKFYGNLGSSQVSLARYSCGNTGLLTGQLVSATPANSTQFLWPIPALEVGSNPTLAAQQNPGY